MKIKNLSNPERWILLGIPTLFLLGAIFHFLYDFTGKISLIGIMRPVNSSVWEHMKMSLFPIVGWWGIYYFVKGKKHKIDNDLWFTAALM